MADANVNGQGKGNFVFNDKAIAYGLASIAATVFGILLTWQLNTALETKERVVRIEATVADYPNRLSRLESVVFPPSPAFRGHQ